MKKITLVIFIFILFAFPKVTLASTRSPTITSATVLTSYSPWHLDIRGTNFDTSVKARLIDTSGAQWGSDTGLYIINSTNSSIQLPSNSPPSGCNNGKTCTIQIQLVDSTGTLSNKVDLVLPAAPNVPTGQMYAVDNNSIINGYAVMPGNASTFVPIKLYADVASPATPSTSEYMTTVIANKAGPAGSPNAGHYFEYAMPDRFKDGKPHLFYAYVTNSADQDVEGLYSPSMYPNEVTSAWYLAPNYPAPTGWAADSKNYFNEWSCSSTTGIDTIRRLNITPPGTHHPLFGIDSTWTNNVDTSGNFPVVYFSANVTALKNVQNWTLKKATFDTSSNTWKIFDVLYTPNPNGWGVSSQDGYGDDYVMNEYNIAGWGPTANKPGSKSKILGVSETTSPPGHTFPNTASTYPLVGTGPLGLTTITELKQNDTAFWNGPYPTCFHMNPTLFDYDTNGVPHSFMAWLFTSPGPQACKLPSGAPIAQLQMGNYVYHYQGPELGWQLDLSLGDKGRLPGGGSTNYSFGSNKKFLTNWDPFATNPGGQEIDIFDLNEKSPTSHKILDCTNTKIPLEGFSEISGSEKKAIFYAVTDGGRDIYYAYDSTPQNPADLNTDGKIDIFDYNILLGNFDKTGAVGFVPGDIDKNGKVDIFDYNILVGNFGK